MSNYVKQFFEQRETTNWNRRWWKHNIMRTWGGLAAVIPACGLLHSASKGHRQGDTDVLVVDCGFDTCKTGFTEDNTLSCVPTHRLVPQHQDCMVGVGQKDNYMGGKIQGRLSVQTLEYPMEQGIITHPDDVGKIWHYHTSYKENVSLRNGSLRTSLVVQWLRLCLSMQGTKVQFLVRDLRSHMPPGN